MSWRSRDLKAILDGKIFAVESGQWRAKVIGEPVTRVASDLGSTTFVDYQIEFNCDGKCLGATFSVWSPILDRSRPDEPHSFLRSSIEGWLEDPDKEEGEVWTIGPPI